VMGAGSLWVQMSTVGVAGIEELIAAAQRAGVDFVDAPVSGTKEPAEAGELVVLASGDEHAVDRARPVFDAVGSRTFRLGAAGAGTRMKLVVNDWLLTVTAGLAETLALSQSLGLEARDFLSVIENGPLSAPYAETKAKLMLEQSFEPSFPLEHAAKDAGLVLEAGRAAGADLTITCSVAERFAEAMDEGVGRDDIAAVYVTEGATRG
jgi:3-hydroxyisobutyrate dehydrogenase